ALELIELDMVRSWKSKETKRVIILQCMCACGIEGNAYPYNVDFGIEGNAYPYDMDFGIRGNAYPYDVDVGFGANAYPYCV
nr:hypothetical protein [Tanacetum cinerariifolium]